MSNQTIDLFEKTLGAYQATSVPEAQRRVQDLIEVPPLLSFYPRGIDHHSRRIH